MSDLDDLESSGLSKDFDQLADGCGWLREVNLQQTRISDESLKLLLNRCAIDWLNISQCERLTEESVEAIEKSISLRSIVLGGGRIGSSAVHRLGFSRSDIHVDFESNDQTGLGRSTSEKETRMRKRRKWKKSKFDSNSFLDH